MTEKEINSERLELSFTIYELIQRFEVRTGKKIQSIELKDLPQVSAHSKPEKIVYVALSE